MLDRNSTLDKSAMTQSLKDKRVLIVEDEALIAMMAEDMIQALGAQVVGPASTVEEALELAQQADVDIALLDVNLRDARIDPVAEFLQSKQVPFVLATGYGQAKADLPTGALVVQKPYTQERLQAALTAVVAAERGAAGQSLGS
jgi:two-component SAPR family response regulator